MSVVPGVTPLNFPFRNLWSILDRQQGLVTCTTISPSGMWVVSGSQDGTVLFVDHRAGVPIGKLDLEAEFYATAAVWRSDTILIFGCSNGVVYHLDFEHTSRRPVSVHPLVKPLKSPVRAVAFDTFRDMLAIACGGEVWIYLRADATGTESWGCVDHILAPCAGPPGLVTALCFFGTALSCRHLFIAHAKAGWNTWLSPRNYNRTPFTEYGDVCSIGSVTIPPSERFIAIATLDNSIVTYSLVEGGPDVDTYFEFKSQELTNYRPVLPIASTSSGLVLKGTAVGDIDVLDTKTRATTSLGHAPNHIIRTLNAYGDKLVVGSSELTENHATSCLRCYTFSNTTEPRDWRRIDESYAPVFQITLSSILPFTERIALYNPLGNFGIWQTIWLKFQQRRSLFFFLVGLGVLLLALTPDTPARVTSISIRGVRTSPPPTSQSTTLSRNPTLFALIRWSAGYLSGQVSDCVSLLTQTIAWIVKLMSYGGLMAIKGSLFALSSLTRVLFLIPRLLKEALSEVPDLLANIICDILRVYGFNDVCPE